MKAFSSTRLFCESLIGKLLTILPPVASNLVEFSHAAIVEDRCKFRFMRVEYLCKSLKASVD